MSDNYKDILSNLSTEVDQQTLLLYLQGKLSEDKKHEVEKHLVDSEFADEAIEGLQEFKDKEQLQYMVEMLNRDLKKKTQTKKKRREKMKIKDQPWLYVSILILILLIALSYIVLHKMLSKP
jgi:predicted anti-sigma-YlaC factor YlaD